MNKMLMGAAPVMAPYYPKFRRSQLVADKLRTMIAEGSLPMGSKLPTEQQLCKEFGVSRTTLREATQMLRTEGLLDVTPGRGSFVCRPDRPGRLRQLALAVRGEPGMDVGRGFEVLGIVLQPLVPLVCRRPEPLRHMLMGCLLQPKQSGQDNAEMERAWLGMLPELALSPMAGMVCQVVLEVVGSERARGLENPEAVLRASHAQLRVANALVSGDMAVAGRLLDQYLRIPTESLAAAPAKMA